MTEGLGPSLSHQTAFAWPLCGNQPEARVWGWNMPGAGVGVEGWGGVDPRLADLQLIESVTASVAMQ